jgi:hypothetical protein
MVNHHGIGLTRINRKVNPNVTTVSYNSYELNAQSKWNIKHASKRKDKDTG